MDFVLPITDWIDAIVTLSDDEDDEEYVESEPLPDGGGITRSRKAQMQRLPWSQNNKWAYVRDRFYNITTGKFHCPKCNNGYGRRDTMLTHHRYECGVPPRFKCPHCHLVSKKTSNIYQHIRSVHPNQQVSLIKLY
ncbi:hypothetical protein QAD02_022646 [Eretmocerus hayati]|uniref:Uncharacterized protein n=1 Tax=Eretmocerus hayati TaxID=131215 RepID=A0ACC2PTW7_9HYME|nr:hypothetical protein QAD02_022646 [Eretmocerus hayati]